MDRNNSFASRSFSEDDIWTGTPTKITNQHNTIKIAYNNADGRLRVYQSPNGKLWDYYNSQETVIGNGFKQVGINGNYFYIWYEHLNGTNQITLTTNLSSQIHDQFDVKLTPIDTITIDGLTFTEDGALVVSGAGGGTGGDSSASNQVASNLAVCTRLDNINTELGTQTDRVLYDLDIIANRLHDVQGSIEVTNQITGYATSQLQTDSNLAVCTRLSTLNQVQEDMLLSVDGINTKLSPLKVYEAKYNIEAAPLLQSPGQNPSYTTPPSSLGIPASEGYYYKNSVLGGSQLYYYSWLNLSAQPADQTKPFRLDAITNSYAVLRVGNVDTSASIPFIGIYTRPQGSGDFIPGFARSRRVYTLPAQSLTQGMKFMIWWGTVAPHEKLWPGVPRIQATLALANGPQLGTELVGFMSINSDSGAQLNKVEYIVSGAGWQVSEPGLTSEYSLTFSGESSSTTTVNATATNQVASNTAICTRLDTANTTLGLINTNLDQLNYSGTNLLVSDTNVLQQLQYSNLVISTILEALGDSIPVINYGLLNDTPQYIPVRATNTGNLCVLDAETRDELLTLNETMADLVSGTSQLSVSLDPANDGVGLYAFNNTSMMPEALTCKVLSTTTTALDVNVANQISGFSTETTLNDISTLVSSQSAYSRFQSETPVTDGKLDTIINNMSLTNFNVNNLTKCDTDNVAIPGGVDINNLPTIQQVSLSGETVGVTGTFWQETQPVSISGTIPISSGSPLDVHCYGSSDGVNYHHLKTNPQGVLKTNAIMETDENGALTSEVKTGTGAYNALHCWVKNSITLDAGSTTNVTTLDPISTKSQSSLNSEIANDTIVNGPVSIGVADSDGYLWVSAQVQMNEVTAAGTLYLEYSAEGAIWFRGNTASESVYVNTSVSQQRVLIRPQTPTTMRYVRVYAEGTFAATGVSAWVSMK